MSVKPSKIWAMVVVVSIVVVVQGLVLVNALGGRMELLRNDVSYVKSMMHGLDARYGELVSDLSRQYSELSDDLETLIHLLRKRITADITSPYLEVRHRVSYVNSVCMLVIDIVNRGKESRSVLMLVVFSDKDGYMISNCQSAVHVFSKKTVKVEIPIGATQYLIVVVDCKNAAYATVLWGAVT